MCALMALALGACTSDDIALNDNVVGGGGLDGDSYISFAINLPTQASTRAANDQYDDGMTSEYAVSDATLLLFGGTDEASATFYASYTLTTSFQDYSPENDNITSRSQLTQQIETPTSGDIYALVLLNASGMLTGSDGSLALGGVSLSGATLSDLQNGTNATLSDLDAMIKDNYLYMANAPLISAAGGVSNPSEGTVTTLAKIDESKIFTTAAEAQANPATEIYVERGMAKVTVTDATGTTTVEDAKIEGFILDLTNNVSYPVRNTTTGSAEGSASWWGLNSGSPDASLTDKYRMAGSVAVAPSLYRTYWATDPNYNADPVSGELTSLAGTTPELGGLGDNNPQYCLENTFSVAHQNKPETTRAIIGVTLNKGNEFYILDGYGTMLEEDAVKAEIIKSFRANGTVEAAEALYTGSTEIENAYTVVFDNDEETSSNDLTFRITYDTEIINANNFKDNTLPFVFDETNTSVYGAVMEDLNSHHTVAYYAGGLAYYPVWIKHFGDDLTPWDMDDVTAGSASGSYPDGIYSTSADNNWLGRYGVLRNNWYEISVTDITDIGYPLVPEAPDEADDPTDKYISIEINVLSWAKRTQSATL